jgi:hypothetical protein
MNVAFSISSASPVCPHSAGLMSAWGQKRRDRPSALVDQLPQYPESGLQAVRRQMTRRAKSCREQLQEPAKPSPGNPGYSRDQRAETLPTVISAFGTPVRTATPHVDQYKVPNNLLVNEPSLSTQGIGGSSGR